MSLWDISPMEGPESLRTYSASVKGFWINTQGKDRKSKKKGKKELKLGIFYEGWEKIHQKNARYTVVNKNLTQVLEIIEILRI